MEIGFLAAFVGGALALLSPCGALLIPAYLASTVGSGQGAARGVLRHGTVFFAGLLITLVPLGLGAGAVGGLLIDYRPLIVAATSLLLIVLGLLQFFGVGVDLSTVLPGAKDVRRASGQGGGYLRSLLLGMASGVAGLCAGPLLGAILTLALTQASLVFSAALMVAYALGMVVPLVAITLAFHRLGVRGRRLLRGRGFQWGKLTLHTTNMVAGVLIAGLGVLMWATNGLVSAPSLLSSAQQARLQEATALLALPGLDIAVIIVLAIAGLALWWRADRRRARESGETP